MGSGLCYLEADVRPAVQSNQEEGGVPRGGGVGYAVNYGSNGITGDKYPRCGYGWLQRPVADDSYSSFD